MSNPQPILEDFLTRDELAAELRRSPRTLDRWEVLGIGPPRTIIGRTVLYRRTSTQRWLAAQENRGGSNAASVERSSDRELRGAL
jgi:hypothetical protein